MEWFSALEGAVAKIVRAVAGLEEEDQTPAVDTRSSSSGRDRDWANQLEKGFASVSKSSSSRPNGNAMVNIVGYSGGGGGNRPYARRSESFAADNGNYGGTISYGQIDGEAFALTSNSHSMTHARMYEPDRYHTTNPMSVQVSSTYAATPRRARSASFCVYIALQHAATSYRPSLHTAGIAGVANMDEPRSNSSSVQVSYPAYPTLQPIASNPPASSYVQYTAPAQQDYSQGHNHYDQGSQLSSYQQQVHQQPHQQQQQQPYQPIVGDMSGSQTFAPPFTDPTGQQPVQVQSSYQQVNPCMHCCVMCAVSVVPCCYVLIWLTCRGVIGECARPQSTCKHAPRTWCCQHPWRLTTFYWHGESKVPCACFEVPCCCTCVHILHTLCYVTWEPASVENSGLCSDA